MRTRDNNIEVYRTLLMFGICLLHSATRCGHPNMWIQGLLSPCVNGFVFISGYYGMKFSPSKIVRLYGVGLFCAWIIVTLTRVYFGVNYCGTGSYYFDIYRLFKHSFWFLHAYVVMMLLAPLVDGAIDSFRTNADIKRLVSVLLPPLILVFVWAGFTATPKVNMVTPSSGGVTAYSGLTLLGTYVFARLYRIFNFGQYLSVKVIALSLPVLILLSCCLRLYEYSTPVALCLAMIYFSIFSRIQMGIFFEKLSILGPSLFSIYLIHSQGFGFVWMRHVEEGLLTRGIPLWSAYILTALIIFGGCLMIDVPRRMLCWVFGRPIRWLCEKIDQSYEYVVVTMARKLQKCSGDHSYSR